ncbi:SycD/LcrH family type III secretion system chaperone [Bordetella genomosp. 13]|uniref:SycD/LcrH family type III secretion system chaperone n=1 Tax=Bordetella genomosp. 13 TaxID=463040 RepID=UPI0021B6A38B|nr:SycD/LcrH family type III secretion system chaperone [Bordetella genomosp. 13]
MSQTATAPRSEFGEKLYQGLQALPSSKRFTAEQLEVIYALAYAQVTQGKYAEALPVFSILSTYGPTRKHYMMGLALCLQMCARYEEAVRIYSAVGTLFPEGPEASLGVAECLLALGLADEAAEEASLALRYIDESGAYPEARARAQALLDLAHREAVA